MECPTGSGRYLTLGEVAQELSRRLTRIFLPEDGRGRPVNGAQPRFRERPALAGPGAVLRVLQRRHGRRARREPPDGMDGAGGQAAAAERRVAWEARGGCASVSRMGEAEPAAAAAVADEAALVAGLKARRPEAFETLVRTTRRGCWPWRCGWSAAPRTRRTSSRTRCCRRTGPSTGSKALARVDLAAPDRRQRRADEAADAAPQAGGADRAAAADVPRGRAPRARRHGLERAGRQDGRAEPDEADRPGRDPGAAGHLQGRAHPARHPGREHRGDGEGAGHHVQRREDPVAPGAPGIARAAEQHMQRGQHA